MIVILAYSTVEGTEEEGDVDRSQCVCPLSRSLQVDSLDCERASPRKRKARQRRHQQPSQQDRRRTRSGPPSAALLLLLDRQDNERIEKGLAVGDRKDVVSKLIPPRFRLQ